MNLSASTGQSQDPSIVSAAVQEAVTPEPSFLDPVAQALLSLPLPSGITIILLTLLLRSCITLPATLWQRRRLIKNATEVMPRMKAINDRLAGVVAKESRAKNLSYEDYKKELKKQLAVEQSKLHNQFGTHPTLTLVAPLAVHIPVLILTSLTLRRALELPGSSMASESFLWLESLGEVDGTGILPILGALLAMSNAEVTSRKGQAALARAVSAEEEAKTQDDILPGKTAPARPRPRPPWARRFSTSSTMTSSNSTQKPRRAISQKPASNITAQPATQSTSQLSSSRPTRPNLSAPGSGTPSTPQEHLTSLNPESEGPISEVRKSELRNRIITNAMRVSAVLFVPIASSVPSALALYWASSMAFTLGQSLYLGSLDKARRAMLKTSKAV